MSELFLTEAEVLNLDPWSMPIEDIDVSQPNLFKTNKHFAFFERLRKQDPVHYCKDSVFGPFWSITRFNDIMAIDIDHQNFSSIGGVSLGDRPEGFKTPNFISMDPPLHDEQRMAVTGVVAPKNLAELESVIRQRAGKILDELPVGETFDWVDRVSIELTTQMLAAIFDFPFEDRRKLTYWSDLATSTVATGGSMPEASRREGLMECLEVFTKLRRERESWNPSEHNDLITMMAHSHATKNMDQLEYLGNLILLIVGGNDTTRNSISGGVFALNQYPAEYNKLRKNHGLIGTMVPEIIRWQTPLSYMRRRCINDTVVNGKTIRAGDKVAMWYCSGNRDETVIENPNDFIVDRKQPRHHLAFGFGIHRCMGRNAAESHMGRDTETIRPNRARR